jgi:transposase, IS30 family
MRLCPETIYRELLLRDNTTLHNRYCLKLHTGRRIRKSRWLTRTGHGPTIINKTLIDKRPASAETKLEAGHWEGDLVRHEALQYRAEVRDLCRCVVAAA